MNVPRVSDEYIYRKLEAIAVIAAALPLKLDYLSEAAVEDIEDIALALAEIVQDIVVKEEVEDLELLFSMESER